MSYLTSPPTVIFDGKDLNLVDGLLVESRNIYNTGSRSSKIYKLAQTSKSILVSSEYTTKLIVVDVAIARPSRDLMDSSLDTLYSYLQGIEKNLDIIVAGQTRRYTATVTRISTKSNNGGFIRVNIEFTCSDPYGYDLTVTQLINNLSVTSGSSTTNINIEGSAEATPYITAEIVAITGGTNKTLVIRNAETGIGISAYRTWVAGDVLTINGVNKEVRVNGVLFDTNGKTPHFEPGLRIFAHSDDFTTRTIKFNVEYYKRYI